MVPLLRNPALTPQAAGLFTLSCSIPHLACLIYGHCGLFSKLDASGNHLVVQGERERYIFSVCY